MTINANFPLARPSLLLDFANSQELDPRITFSRPTTATCYDNHTTAVAEQNLLTYSQAIGGTNWTALFTIALNNAVAPDGTTTATYCSFASAGGKWVQQTNSNSGGAITTSVYAKVGIGILQFFYGGSDGTAYANFDLTNGVLGNYNGAATITSVGSGWYRCTHTYTFANSASATSVYFAIVDSTTSARAASTTLTSGGVYLWGAQLEQRSSVTAYNATTTTAITNYIPVLQTAPSNQARFDHDPVAGTSLGLLIEQQSTNLTLYSSDFSNAYYWVPNASTISSNVIVAPDGTISGDLLSYTGAGARVNYFITASSTSATFSVYCKGNSGTRLIIRNTTTATNLVTGNFTGSTFTPDAGGSIQSVGNGWYRCIVTATTGITSGDTLRLYVYTDVGGGTAGTSVFLWGAQLEAGALPTSYIPTTSASVTRVADNASMIGTNFSGWFNAGQGSFYAEAINYTSLPNVQEQYVYAYQVGNTNNRIELSRYTSGATARNDFAVIQGGVSQADLNSLGTTTIGSSIKIAGAYNTNAFAVSFNGATALTDSSGLVPSGINAISIGSTSGGAYFINGTIKKLAYYPIAATSAQLQALTGS